MENSKTLHSAAPMVSICCLVYNHELFLRECLDGFVMQKTTFPIEILVHDDASTDHSADIIREYTAKYPDLFKPIYQTENQYSKGNGFVGITLNLERAKGKYIAMCEGDDYWTDPLKLQKQVEFLEGHEEYVLSFHNVKVIDFEGNQIENDRIDKNMFRDWSEYDIMCGHTPPTPTLIFRSIYYKKNINVFACAKKLVNGDTILTSILGKYGKGKFLADIGCSICRVHPGGVWQMKSLMYKRDNSYKTYTFLQKIHKNNKDVRFYFFNTRLYLVKKIIEMSIEENDKKKFLYFYFIFLRMMFRTCDLKTLYLTNKDIAHWIKVKLNN